MEELFCRTTECNLHDFKINAGGVCRYIDFMWLQQQMIPAQPEVIERVVSIEKPVERSVEERKSTTNSRRPDERGYQWSQQ